MNQILITGGAGFVGSYLAKRWKTENPQDKVVVFDNLKRRGSELNLAEFKKLGVSFHHGDIRKSSDLEDLNQNFDLFIEASAEPSVLAGVDGGSPNYLIDTNLVGTLNCLEFGRKKTRGMVFLSTSRVYSIPALRAIPIQESDTRFVLSKNAGIGLSESGINENFPIIGQGFRSLYGTTKFASELFCQEYSENFKYPVCVNRCGVIAGPGQFGKTDQGVFTLWVANHYFGKDLKYTGFGGTGKQIRDLLHPEDLFSLIQLEANVLEKENAIPRNIGGGFNGSVSLLEYTKVCEQVVGNSINILSDPQTNPVDIPFYISDCKKAEKDFGWKPKVSPTEIVTEIHRWIKNEESTLKEIF